jgi:FKBP-type peptidyl-prolyl cis-trans isomerase FkpA
LKFAEIPMNHSSVLASVVLFTLGATADAQVEPAGSAPPAAVSTPVMAADGSQRWPSGLVYRSLREGTGASPLATDTVKVHYRGTFPSGKEFDSSYTRGQPAEFPLNRVIACWTEGVQKMKVGGKAKLICPATIAYGSKGAGKVIPPGATLHFDVELLGIAGR